MKSKEEILKDALEAILQLSKIEDVHYIAKNALKHLSDTHTSITDSSPINALVIKVKSLLAANGYLVTSEKPLDYGYQLKTGSGGVINIYTSGKILVQGKDVEKLQELVK